MTSSIVENPEKYLVPCNMSSLPAEVLEMVLVNVSTMELLKFRRVCSNWNNVSKRILRLRHVRLVSNWFQKTNGMQIFRIFYPNSLPWSEVVLPIGLQDVCALRQPFLNIYGENITSLDVPEFADTFNIFDVICILPNLEKLHIPTIKHPQKLRLKILDRYKLPKLKLLKISLCTNNQWNANFMTLLLGLVPSTLKLLEVINLPIVYTQQLHRIAILFLRFQSIHLSIKIVQQESFVAFDKLNLNVHKLHMLCFKNISSMKSNFISSLEHLSHLTIRMWVASPRIQPQLIQLPTLSTLTHLYIQIGNWTRPLIWIQDVYEIQLIVRLKLDLFPKLKKLNVSSNYASSEMEEIRTCTCRNGTILRCFGSGTRLLQTAKVVNESNFQIFVDNCPRLRLYDEED